MSRTLLELSFFVYLLAFGDYVLELASHRKIWKLLGPVALGLGLLLQAVALLARWVDAGKAELAAAQEALGHPLQGSARLLAAIGHPPCANLYESLLSLSFLVLLVYFVSERRWRLRALGCVAVGIGTVLLGRALLAPHPGVELLDPALRSYWILLHVSAVLLALACFLVACAFGLALLIKVQTPSSQIGAGLTALAVPVVLLAGGARSLFGRLTFQMSLSGLNEQGLLAPVRFVPTGTDRAQPVLVDVSGVGPFLLLAALLYGIAAFFYFRSTSHGEGEVGTRHVGFWTTLAATASLAIATGLLFWSFWFGGSLALPSLAGPIERGLSPPYRLALAGSPDAVGLLVATLACSLAFLAFTRFRARLRDTLDAELPDPARLDDLVYRVIALGFPLLSLGIVIGGVWAHTAWGRYWSWDPKETWALITWLVYVLYLHTRLTLGWTGKRGALIAVVGFAVVIFCYLGVNLGLTGETLHAYGSG